MMTIPLLLLYEVGYAGAVVIAAPAAEGRPRSPALVLLALVLGGAPARGPGARPAAAAAGPGRLGPDSLQDTHPPGSPARRSTAPPPAGSASRPRPPAASRPTTPCSRRSRRRPGYQATRYRADSATVFIEDERVLLAGAGADRAAGRHARGGHHPLPSATAACSTRAASPQLFDRGQVLVGRGHPLRHLPPPRDRERRADQLHRGVHGLVPAGQRGPGLELQPDLRRRRARSPAATCRRRTITSPPGR